MLGKSLMGVALLAALIGCRDGPTALEIQVEHPPPVQTSTAASADVQVSVQDILDDPLVGEIVEILGDRTVASGWVIDGEVLQFVTSCVG